MPFLIRVIAQRLLALSLGFLAFLGINPTIPTEQEVAVFNQQREEIVENILTDVENKNINIDKNLIENLLEPEKNTKKNIVESPSKKEISTPQKEIPSPSDQKTIDQEKIPTIKEPIDVVIETVAEKIGIKDQKTLELENILVNIICTEKKGNYVTANTGSGVIVSSSGIVMTNAHV
jgi:S1-C subfamily serine protease